MNLEYLTLDDLHQLCHLAKNDPEQTVTVALGVKDVLLVGLGQALVYNFLPCLREDVDLLGTRISELMNFQWGDTDIQDLV